MIQEDQFPQKKNRSRIVSTFPDDLFAIGGIKYSGGKKTDRRSYPIAEWG